MATQGKRRRAWRVRRAEAGDRERTLDLARRAFGRDAVPGWAADRWEWIFVNNPSRERLHYLLAEAGGRLVGQYAMMPVRMQHAGRAIVGLLSLDTATDPGFARQGIFTTLASQVYAEARAEAPLVFGFPNSNSAPGFYGKLDWVELRPVPEFVRPLGHWRQVMRMRRPALMPLATVVDLGLAGLRGAGRVRSRFAAGRGIRVETFENFGTWADDLWQGLSPDLGTCVVRDRAYLQWRYGEGPFSYGRYALWRDGEVAGFAVIRAVPWHGAKLGHLMELMVRKGDRAGAGLLLGRALLEGARAGAAVMWAIFTRRHPHRAALLQAGFLPLPKALRAQSFGVRVNGPGVVPDQLLHMDDWYITCGDLDGV